MRAKVLVQGLIVVALTGLTAAAQSGWPHYGGDSGGSRYSATTQINRQNVARLQPAWTFRTGDLSDGKSKFEATPILFNRLLYVSTPFNRVIALDPSTGKQWWAYDPEL